MRKSLLVVVVFLGLLNISKIGWAIPYGGVEFLNGTASFADLSVSHKPFIDLDGTLVVEGSYPLASLGIPDYKGGPGEVFSHVRFRDDPDQGDRNFHPPYRADLDDFGAIATGPRTYSVSEPGTMLLLGFGLVILAKYARHKLN